MPSNPAGVARPAIYLDARPATLAGTANLIVSFVILVLWTSACLSARSVEPVHRGAS
jgi:hypothetical protein